MSLQTFPPPLSAAFFDPPSGNSLFPTAARYSDARILPLVLALAFAGAAVLLFVARQCPRRLLSRLDAFANASVLVGGDGPITRGTFSAYKSVPHQTSLGGLLTVVAALVAVATSLDVLLQYAADAGIEATATQTPPSLAADGVAAGAQLTVTAAAASSSTVCIVTSARLDGAVSGTFLLTGRSRSAASPTPATSPNSTSGSGGTCVFSFSCAALLLTSPFADPTLPAPAGSDAQLMVALGQGLQVVSWSLSVADAKAGAATAGGAQFVPMDVAAAPPGTNVTQWPPAPTPQLAAAGLVGSTTRLHSARVQLVSSTRINRVTDSAPDAVSYGLRAVFGSYSVVASPGVWEASGAAGGDALLVLFSRSSFPVVTVLTQRYSVLALIGICFGLSVGSFVFFKTAHDLLDGACGLVRRERDAELEALAAVALLNADGSSTFGLSPGVVNALREQKAKKDGAYPGAVVAQAPRVRPPSMRLKAGSASVVPSAIAGPYAGSPEGTANPIFAPFGTPPSASRGFSAGPPREAKASLSAAKKKQQPEASDAVLQLRATSSIAPGGVSSQGGATVIR
jgi:hypothetical protein